MAASSDLGSAAVGGFWFGFLPPPTFLLDICLMSCVGLNMLAWVVAISGLKNLLLYWNAPVVRESYKSEVSFFFIN
jgi:hypothetical protein